MSDKKAISTKGAPAAIGPYSQAVRVGDFLYSSGQVALDPGTGVLVEGGIEAQTTRVLENLKAVLEAAGIDLIHVVKRRFSQKYGRFCGNEHHYISILRRRALSQRARRSWRGCPGRLVEIKSSQSVTSRAVFI